jgi:oligopeptide transport system ATP-binding protein
MGMALMLITHDLGIVADACDRICVMYAGQIVEEGDVYEIFKEPMHPYTMGLLKSTLSIDEFKETLVTIEGTVPDGEKKDDPLSVLMEIEEAQHISRFNKSIG